MPQSRSLRNSKVYRNVRNNLTISIIRQSYFEINNNSALSATNARDITQYLLEPL